MGEGGKRLIVTGSLDPLWGAKGVFWLYYPGDRVKSLEPVLHFSSGNSRVARGLTLALKTNAQ